MKETLVSINITSGRVLKNPGTDLPILYDYVQENENDTTSSINDKLFSDDGFMSCILNNCTVEDYPKLKVSYFYFDFNVNDSYVGTDLMVQDRITLEHIEKTYSGKPVADLYLWYIMKHIGYLYTCSYKKEYEPKENTSLEDSIKEIYNLLIEKNPKKISQETVSNYIRSELTKDKLSKENINYILKKLENLLWVTTI